MEFQTLGFQPQPAWTAQTVLTRMPGWTLSRNASSEVMRALEIKAFGVAKAQDLQLTLPEKKLEVPPALDLDQISPAILDVTKGANDLRWTLTSDRASAQPPLEQFHAELGSNNWVVDGTKSATGGPILANDPHREVVNPALRYVVHLVAPGWNALGGTEPGVPGISIGHNERIAWGFTILGMDQQDLYVEETDPQHPNRYLADGQWKEMTVERQLIPVKGTGTPQEFVAKFTRHGPVLYEDTTRHRAFALRWIGAEPGGAGYLGSMNVMQAKTWQEFKAGMPKAWYIPSHIWASDRRRSAKRGTGSCRCRAKIASTSGTASFRSINCLRASIRRSTSITRRTTTWCRRSSRATRSRSATSTSPHTGTTG